MHYDYKVESGDAFEYSQPKINFDNLATQSGFFLGGNFVYSPSLSSGGIRVNGVIENGEIYLNGKLYKVLTDSTKPKVTCEEAIISYYEKQGEMNKIDAISKMTEDGYVCLLISETDIENPTPKMVVYYVDGIYYFAFIRSGNEGYIMYRISNVVYIDMKTFK